MRLRPNTRLPDLIAFQIELEDAALSEENIEMFAIGGWCRSSITMVSYCIPSSEVGQLGDVC